MKKADAERSIRHFCHVWGDAVGVPRTAESDPSFSKFKSWLDANGHSDLLKFKSLAGADYDAEQWFIEEFKQHWRY